MPILAVISIPRWSPRERIQTLSARVRTNQKNASPGRAKIDSASIPR